MASESDDYSSADNSACGIVNAVLVARIRLVQPCPGLPAVAAFDQLDRIAIYVRLPGWVAHEQVVPIAENIASSDVIHPNQRTLRPFLQIPRTMNLQPAVMMVG